MTVICDRAWLGMSVIIAVCGENFCTFVVDTRRTTNVGSKGMVFENDDTQKIFKLNSNTLFGAVGLFNNDEAIMSALDGLEITEATSPKRVHSWVHNYLDERKYDIPPRRTYLVGGKAADGKFRIWTSKLNAETFEVEENLYQPGAEGNFAMLLCLPPKAVKYQEKYYGMVRQAILTSQTHKQMVQKLGNIIADISDVDDSVGKTVRYLNLF